MLAGLRATSTFHCHLYSTYSTKLFASHPYLELYYSIIFDPTYYMQDRQSIQSGFFAKTGLGYICTVLL
jgi:hypothetical protein